MRFTPVRFTQIPVILAMTLASTIPSVAENPRHRIRRAPRRLRHQGGRPRGQVRRGPATRSSSSPSPTATRVINPKAEAFSPRAGGAEAEESGRRLGIDYEVLDNHDGRAHARAGCARSGHPQDPRVGRRHRDLSPSERLPPRPPLYRRAGAGRGLHGHGAEPRHGYPGAAQEPAVFSISPTVLTQPQAFRPDVVVSIDDVIEKKYRALRRPCLAVLRMAALACRHSRPSAPKPERAARLAEIPRSFAVPDAWREAARKRYGGAADAIENAEAFEITEYGRSTRRGADPAAVTLLPGMSAGYSHSIVDGGLCEMS